MRWFAPNGYMPVLSSAAALFASFRIVPAGLATLIKPFGTPFRVTPKGSGISFRFGDPTVLVASFLLILLTVGGVIKNRIAPSASAVDNGAVMMVAEAWALVNVVLLAVAALIGLESPRPRKEERFPLDEPAEFRLEGLEGLEGVPRPCRVVDISVSGALLAEVAEAGLVPVGTLLELALPGMGALPARVVRVTETEGRRGLGLGVCFEALPGQCRDALIRYIYSSGRNNAVETVHVGAVLRGLFRAFVRR
jgi:cellulose synthase (UDP-forming)